MIKFRNYLSIFLILLGIQQIHAQDSTVVSDFELWTGVQLKKSFLEDKLTAGLTQEFRFNDNSTSINNFFTEVELGYEFYKGIRVDAGYRFIRNNRKSGYLNEGRFFADLNYKHKLDRFKFSYRFRYQNQSALGDVVDDDVVNKYRLKFKAEYNIRKWKLDPYFAVEGFFAQTTNNINYIATITESERVSGFEKLRFTIGTEYNFNKKISLGGFYRYERELGSFPLNYNTSRNYFIAGVNLKFDL